MECLNAMLARNVRRIGDKPFILFAGESVSYARFAERVAKLARVLAAHGAQKGEPVGLYLPSNLTMALGFWACQHLGAIPVPMSAMYRDSEIVSILGKTEMRVMIADVGTYPQIEPLRRQFPKLEHVLVDGPGGRLADLIAAADSSLRPEPCEADDIAALFFTSGTTGTPKGTVQTQFNHYSMLRDMMAFHRTQYGQEVYLGAVPLFTNLGMNVILGLAMFTGGTVILHERWNTQAVLESIRVHRVTFLCGTPTMFIYMVNEFDVTKDDLSSLRLCTTGGSPVPDDIMKKFESFSHAPVIQVYGATESLGQSVMEPVFGVRKPGSAGVVIGSSRLSIIDETGEKVGPGVIGEVVISGDPVAKGYWRDPEATARAFTPHGWVSGDLGYLDQEGYLFLVDRKKDVILAGGHNIYPIEVETILYRHPAVAMCALVGIPDPSKGEIPVAVIERKQGVNATGADIIAFCRQHLAVYKAPRRVYFVDEMPIQASKIRKRDLIAGIANGTLKPEA
jgi:acyl-CoA synthetase (AMP-forming)/AMP-acid ligase II